MDHKSKGGVPRLSKEQNAALADLVEKGPDRESDGVVRWRRVDLKAVIKNRFGKDYHERYAGKLLRRLDFSYVSARPQQPGRDAETIQAFKELRRCAESPSGGRASR